VTNGSSVLKAGEPMYYRKCPFFVFIKWIILY